jgi:hypothetical protein
VTVLIILRSLPQQIVIAIAAAIAVATATAAIEAIIFSPLGAT